MEDIDRTTRKCVDKILARAEKRLRQEKRKVKLLDAIIEKTLKEIENAEKTYIDNKSNIRKRDKNQEGSPREKQNELESKFQEL